MKLSLIILTLLILDANGVNIPDYCWIFFGCSVAVNTFFNWLDIKYFNPRLPRGRRLPISHSASCKCNFNPRLPRGRRQRQTLQRQMVTAFQSTPPSREATACGAIIPLPEGHFNPRLPRGRRRRPIWRRSRPSYFNPRLPRGRRHTRAIRDLAAAQFQSTPPSREATPRGHVGRGKSAISIHASLAGGDNFASLECLVRFLFQSTPPSREATTCAA